MKKVTTLVLMLCLVFSGALCYANGTTKTGNEKDWVPIPIDIKECTGASGSDRSNSILPTLDGHVLTVVFNENLGQVLYKAMGFSLVVSPNPATTWIAVDYTLPAGATKAQMRIINALGVTIAAYDLQGDQSQKVLDLRDLSDGVYTYLVQCGKYSQTGKLVIVK